MRAPGKIEPVTAEDLDRVLPITGYLDRISARPGGAIEVKVSAQAAGQYHSDVVRIVSGDPNPDGPGLIYDQQPFGQGAHPARAQPVDRGSYAQVADAPAMTGPVRLFAAHIQPWLLRDHPSVIAAAETADGVGWRLEITESTLAFRYRPADGGTHTVVLDCPLRLERWARVWGGYDCRSGRLVVGACPDGGTVLQAETAAVLDAMPDALPLMMAARLASAVSADHFNGRIEDPCLLGALPAADEVPEPAMARSGTLAAWWDFGLAIDTASIVDQGPHGLGGRLVNLPTRAVRGARWDGSVMRWTERPEHYAAIHFHEDDLSDCRWQTDFLLTIPDGTPSEVYGLRLRQGDAQDILPFYVLPARGAAKAPICFLASTMTHLAYANHARGNTDAGFRARMADWGAAPSPDDYPIYGRSTYNYHPDGSGISLSSRLRPTLTIRPGHLTVDDPSGSGLRHFPADTHLLCWLERKGFDFDVVTDEDIDDEGSALLEGYRTVVTGSHPEYHTGRMLDALQTYRDEGGRLAYLGGNGFYWKIARSPVMPGILEVRRAEGGIRVWATDTGESYHQIDGLYGGLWRRNGRPPQALGGVGFTAQGIFEGSYYRRTEASFTSDHAWIFEGVEEERLGDYGLSGGGAAGFELDRADPALGTPENAAILAVSEGHGDSFVTVPEELLSHLHTITGETPEALIRAEIVYADLPGGGALFTVGSITFCGSLLVNGGDNGISRMLENVLRRFAGGPDG